MKRLNPAMRENFRYILAKIEPYDPHSIYAWATGEEHSVLSHYDAKEIYYTISAAITDWYGDRIAAQIGIAVPAISGPFLIIRVRRGTEQMVVAVLPFIREHLHAEIRFAALKTSGTIRTLKEEIERKRKYFCTAEPILMKKTMHEMNHILSSNIRLEQGAMEREDEMDNMIFSMWMQSSGAVDIDLTDDNFDRKENGFNRIHLQYLTKDDF